MEEKQTKMLYKIELIMLKIIPIILSVSYAINTILSYFNIDCQILSILSGTGIIPIIFLYISSYVFRYCEYHRMFLHYIVINNIITYYDYYIGIPISNLELLILNIIIYFISMIIALIIYLNKNNK